MGNNSVDNNFVITKSELINYILIENKNTGAINELKP